MGASSIEIGHRIYCEGEYGTILYIGTIEGMEGTWLGIEWDNPSRGKHSGCYKDVTYFCTRIPNAGSFIKISKADLGISCAEAIQLKYGKNDHSKPPTFVNLPQNSGKARHIEMVGMEKIMGKQSNFANLTDVVLSNMKVNGPGKSNELKELVPHITNLDLSHNLLSSWSDVIAIAEQLVSLSTLIVSKNRIRVPENIVENLECFSHLKLLIMNEVAYSWKEILSCSSMWPYIKEFSALDNNIKEFSAPSCPVFSQLQVLQLDNNPIRRWAEICKLGNLKNLVELHIDNVALESISFPEVPPMQKTDLFPSLTTLLVRNNKLEQWRDIAELNKLNRLKNLMVSGNPVIYSASPETSRQLIIAKISGLEKLNRSQIDRSERRGAEIDYLKRFRGDWLSNGGNINRDQNQLTIDFLTQHPTYLDLMEKHGAADENEVKCKSLLIKDNLTSVTIFSPQLPEKAPVTKKLPEEMTVGKLKSLVKRIFKITAKDVTLTVVFHEGEHNKTELDNDMRQLSYYSVSNQDKILVTW